MTAPNDTTCPCGARCDTTVGRLCWIRPFRCAGKNILVCHYRGPGFNSRHGDICGTSFSAAFIVGTVQGVPNSSKRACTSSVKGKHISTMHLPLWVHTFVFCLWKLQAGKIFLFGFNMSGGHVRVLTFSARYGMRGHDPTEMTTTDRANNRNLMTTIIMYLGYKNSFILISNNKTWNKRTLVLPFSVLRT